MLLVSELHSTKDCAQLIDICTQVIAGLFEFILPQAGLMPIVLEIGHHHEKEPRFQSVHALGRLLNADLGCLLAIILS